VLIYGHRGSSGTAPENTLAAFEQAIAEGADGIEFDVQATADGVPVVLHDRDVSRTTTGRGNVDELTLAELRGFDAGQGQRVPTLEEVMDLTAGRVRLDVELKQGGIERDVLDVLDRYPEAEWAISSFDWTILATVRGLAPAAELWPLTVVLGENAVAFARSIEATAIALRGDAVTREVVARLGDAGLDLVVWTVNGVEDARLAREMGVAVLITDVPGTIRRGLNNATG